MNKPELIQAIADRTGLSKAATEKTVNALLETVIDTVARVRKCRWWASVAFKLAQRAARQGRNPATGETINIAAADTPKFVPGLRSRTRSTVSRDIPAAGPWAARGGAKAQAGVERKSRPNGRRGWVPADLAKTGRNRLCQSRRSAAADY